MIRAPKFQEVDGVQVRECMRDGAR